MHATRFNQIFRQMKSRCTNPKHPSFARYGERGITVEWPTFLEFYRDMYASYKEHAAIHGETNTTIERIDNDGIYSRGNCRWATRQEQIRNRTCNLFITYKGATKVLTDWCRQFHLDFTSTRTKLYKKHLTLDDCIRLTVDKNLEELSGRSKQFVTTYAKAATRFSKLH
jgi:hypothetical protein